MRFTGWNLGILLFIFLALISQGNGRSANRIRNRKKVSVEDEGSTTSTTIKPSAEAVKINSVQHGNINNTRVLFPPQVIPVVVVTPPAVIPAPEFCNISRGVGLPYVNLGRNYDLQTPGSKAKGSCLVMASIDEKFPVSNMMFSMCDTFLAFFAMVFDLMGQALETELGQHYFANWLEIDGSSFVQTDTPGETFLNMVAVAVFRAKGPDCFQRLLCEANQHASQNSFESILLYMGNIILAKFATTIPLSESWDAIKLGKMCDSCETLYPACPILM